MQLGLYILSIIAVVYIVNIEDEKSLLQVIRSIWIIFYASYLTNLYYNLEMIGYFFTFK